MPTTDEHPADAGGDYRPVSLWALASLVLGVAGAVSLMGVHPGLWLAPAAGVVVAVVALRRIGRVDPTPRGRRAALAALALSSLWFVAGPTYYFSRRATAARQAQRQAEQWLELFRRRQRRAAHQRTLPLAVRCDDDLTLDECYATDRLQGSLQRYFEREPIAQLNAWGAAATYRFQRVARITTTPEDDYVHLLYETDGSVGAGQRLVVVAARKLDPRSGHYYWQFTDAQLR